MDVPAVAEYAKTLPNVSTLRRTSIPALKIRKDAFKRRLKNTASPA